MTDAKKSELAILRRRELESLLKVSRSTIYEWISPSSKRYDPSFPKPFALGGGRAVGWIKAEVEEWLTNQIAASRGGTSQ